MVGPRFEQTAQEFQPRPLAAIDLIAQEPIIMVKGRVAACDGGKSTLPLLSAVRPRRSPIRPVILGVGGCAASPARARGLRAWEACADIIA